MENRGRVVQKKEQVCCGDQVKGLGCEGQVACPALNNGWVQRGRDKCRTIQVNPKGPASQFLKQRRQQTRPAAGIERYPPGLRTAPAGEGLQRAAPASLSLELAEIPTGQWFISQIRRRPSRVSQGAMCWMTSVSWAIAAARPPVPITFMSSPSSLRKRATIPSTSPTYPKSRPDCMA